MQNVIEKKFFFDGVDFFYSLGNKHTVKPIQVWNKLFIAQALPSLVGRSLEMMRLIRQKKLL